MSAAVDRDREALLEDIAIVAWLRGEPYYRSALLALVNAERPRRGVVYAGIEGVDEEALEAERAYVGHYLAASFWGPCANCLAGPVVQFADGRSIWWPSLQPHVCIQRPSPGATSRPAARSASASLARQPQPRGGREAWVRRGAAP